MEIELLAPAGSYETMEAVLNAGADAVYLGGEKFGARAYAQNLDQEQLLLAIRYAHLHGKKLYLTVNTLLKNEELEQELYPYLAPLYEEGLDAVIVQDFGVFRFIRRNFPKLPLHASTQMTVTGPQGARLLAEAGADRVVLARELSLEEIRSIYQATHMEIECFVHGALCYCYSGQCLMSSMIGGRSGNRGRCAQPCRLPYQVSRDGTLLNHADEAYPLNTKDLCTIGMLPQLLEAGVCSLKIEGRMKKPEYAAGVVSVYRTYLDRILSGEPYPSVRREDYQILMDLYNRDGFSEGYYHMRNGRSMMALRNEKNTAVKEPGRAARNEALFTAIRKDYLESKKQEKIKGNVSLYPERPAILELKWGVFHIAAQGALVQEAASRPLTQEQVRRQLQKTGGTPFVFEELTIQMGDRIFLPMQQLNELRRKALDLLQEQVLQSRRRTLPEGQLPASQTVNQSGSQIDNQTGSQSDIQTGSQSDIQTGSQSDIQTGSQSDIQTGSSNGIQASSQRGIQTDSQLSIPSGIQPSIQSDNLIDSQSSNQIGIQPVIPVSSQPGIQAPWEEQNRFPEEFPRLSASVQTWEQLSAVLSAAEISAVYVDCGMFPAKGFQKKVLDVLQEARLQGKQVYLMLPHILRGQELRGRQEAFGALCQEGLSGFLVRNLESYGLLKQMGLEKRTVLDANFYTMNAESQAFWDQEGIAWDTVPLELNQKELRRRDNHGSELILYGYTPMMVSAQCLQKNLNRCDHTDARLLMKDRYQRNFPVVCSCAFCYNTIYNTVPASLLSECRRVETLGIFRYRLAFTVENRRETEEIIRAFGAVYLGGQDADNVSLGIETTKGHFRRGVE